MQKTPDLYEKEKHYRDRKEHRSEEHYKHERAKPYRRECLDWQKLLEEEDDE